MHGWILYSGGEATEITRACQEAAAAGVRLDLVPPKEVQIVVAHGAPATVFRRGQPVPLPMFVIPAFVDELDAYNFALLQQLETLGALCVNRAQTLRTTRDKLLTLQLLTAAGIPVPKTIMVDRDTSPAFLVDQLGLPLVVKLNDGSRGVGVTLVETARELANLLEMLHGAGAPAPILAQEFVADSRGRDLRVLLVDGAPIACMLRRSQAPDGFKSNISTGGVAEAYPLTDGIRALSLRVASLLGLSVGGIDLLFRGDGFLVGEVNSVPGFKGVEACTNVNVPAEFLKSIGRQLVRHAAARGAALAERFSSIDDLGHAGGPELVGWFTSACASTERTQRTVLMDIVSRNAGTAFGKRHGFDGIRSVEEFRERVPLTEWADVEQDASRMEHGEADVRFAGRPVHLVCSSGTSGRMKLLPESREGALAKTLTSRLRLAHVVKLFPRTMGGLVLPLSNTPKVGTTAGGINYGTASGLALAGVAPDMKHRLAFPAEVYEAEDLPVVDYLMMRFAVAQADVRAIVGNVAGRMTTLAEAADARREALIDDIARGTIDPDLSLPGDLRHRLEGLLSPAPDRARDLRAMVAARGRLEPRDYWPHLEVMACWLGGTAGRFLDGLRPWLPERVTYVDCGYGASEGKFNVPITAGVPAAPLALHGYFFEFLPTDDGAPLLAHQLEDGREYVLVITSYSGLYRYNLHDVVRVQGFTGGNPNIRFENSTRDIALLSSVKLSGSFLAEVVAESLAKQQITCRHFCILTSDATIPRLTICVEPQGPEPDAAWLAAFDVELQASSIGYRYFRGHGVIDAPELVLMKPGWQDRLYAEHVRKGLTTSQVKLPVLYRELPHADMKDREVSLAPA